MRFQISFYLIYDFGCVAGSETERAGCMFFHSRHHFSFFIEFIVVILALKKVHNKVMMEMVLFFVGYDHKTHTITATTKPPITVPSRFSPTSNHEKCRP